MNYHGKDQVGETVPEPGTAGRLFRVVDALWATWKLPLLAGILVAIGAFALLAFVRSASPSLVTYTSRVQFTFPQAETGRYPSGQLFSINELVDQTVLDSVYDRLKLEQFKIRREDFIRGFSVRPYASTQNEVIARYRQMLQDRRLTFAERERVESELRTVLEATSRTAAEITFTLRSRFPIPDELGVQIVNTVPTVWAEQALIVKGALNVPGASASDAIIDPKIVEQQSIPVAIVLLSNAEIRLFGRIEEVKRFVPGIQSSRDPETKMSLRDIEQSVRDIRFLSVNYLREVLARYGFKRGTDQEGHERVRLIIDRTIRDLELSAEELTKSSNAIVTAMKQYVDAIVDIKGRGSDRRSGDQTATGGTIIPQVGEGFIDRILELSGRNANQDQVHIADLNRRYLETNERLVTVRGQQERWRDFLRALAASPTETIDEEGEKRMAAVLQETVKAINGNWAILSRIEREFAAQRAGTGGRLYAAYAVMDEVTKTDPVLNQLNVVLAVALGVFTLIAIWGLLLLLQFRKDWLRVQKS